MRLWHCSLNKQNNVCTPFSNATKQPQPFPKEEQDTYPHPRLQASSKIDAVFGMSVTQTLINGMLNTETTTVS